jgi:hypothetical protein
MKSQRALLCALAAVIFSSTVVAQGTVLFREDFESGASGWTFGGLWHVEPDTTQCGASIPAFPSPGHCAWFGAQHSTQVLLCDYSGGVLGGSLVLNTLVTLPQNTGSIVLRYRRFLDTENCIDGYDVSNVSVTTSGGQNVRATDCGSENGWWVDRRVDLSHLAGAQVQVQFEFTPVDNTFNDTLGWCIDDVEIAAEPGVITCTAHSGCPCMGQNNTYQHVQENEDSGGCKHSAHIEARLFADGVASVSADSVEILTHDLPTHTSALVVQGQPAQASVFGDGRLCVGGAIVRMALHTVSNGQDVYPQAGESGIALRGALPAGGGMREYQVVYRDPYPFGYCTSSTFNTSNGYVIVWRP